MKKLIYEISGIILAAIILGLAYNLTSSDFPLVYKPKEIKIASEFDSLFTTTDTATIKNDIVPVDTTKNQVQQVKVDTSMTVKAQNNQQANQVKNSNEQVVAAKDNVKPKTEEQKYKIITFEQLKSKLDNPKIYIIDARSPAKFAEAHIKNAVNIYPFMDDEQEYYRLLTDIPTDKIIVVYCDGGNCDLSHDVVNTLVSLGYTNVYLYLGGWEDWIKNKG